MLDELTLLQVAYGNRKYIGPCMKRQTAVCDAHFQANEMGDLVGPRGDNTWLRLGIAPFFPQNPS